MKTAVITGGTGGIGKAISMALARKHYRVILQGRDPAKALHVEQEIIAESGNNLVESVAADISSLQGMKELVNAIKARTDTVNALVLSTGVILPHRELTPDGLEAGFVIQYLSRFAVTNMLMNELKKGKAKIVSVVAPVIPGAEIHFDDLTMEKNFMMVRAMAQEMFANHLFVQEFAKRHPSNEILINMANPGITDTGIARRLPAILKWPYKLIAARPQKSAHNFVYLASDENVNFSGYFLKKPGKPDVKEKASHDPVVAQKLWEKSMELIQQIL